MPIKNVLVVEDELLLLENIAEEFEDVDLKVYRAMTAQAALDILDTGMDLDLLFTDIRMPGRLNGWDLAEIARARRPGIQVIYASGYSDVDPRLVPGSQLFSKPYQASAILKAIRALETDPPASSRHERSSLLDPITAWRESVTPT